MEKVHKANRKLVRMMRLASDIFDEALSIQNASVPSAVFLAMRRMKALSQDCIDHSDVPYEEQFFTLDEVGLLHTKRILAISKTQDQASSRLDVSRSTLYKARKRIQNGFGDKARTEINPTVETKEEPK